MRKWEHTDLSNNRIHMSPRGSFIYGVELIDLMDDGNETLFTLTLTKANEYTSPVDNYRLYDSNGFATIDGGYLMVIGYDRI